MKPNDKYEILTPDGWKDFSGVAYTGKKETLTLSLSDGSKVTATPEHKFIKNSIPVTSGSLSIGDNLDTSNGSLAITDIQANDSLNDCYDIIDVHHEDHQYLLKNSLKSSNCDELAFVSKRIAINFWTSVFPTLSTGGSCIITSTPTDDETLFADIWKKANDCLDQFGNTTDVGSNGFKALKIKWDEHPERGEDFKELMIKQFGEEKFRREHDLDFIAEDETLISPLVLSELRGIDPIQKTGEVRWYKELDREKIYFIGYDPSLGTGGDNSAIQIFEFPTMEQVGEWMHNKSDVPTQLTVLRKILKLFEDAGFDEDNVRWTLENNAIGEAPLVLIDEYGEDEFFGYFMSEPFNPLDAKKRNRFRKGYNTNGSSKLTACTRMKRWIESEKMTINSKPLVKELKGFVSRGRTYKARVGDHDDLVMAMMLVVRMAMVTMSEEDMYMDALGVNNDMDDEDNDWDAPLPVIF